MKLYFSHRRLVDYLLAVLIASLVHIQPFAYIGLLAWPSAELSSSFSLSVSASSASLLGFVLAANTFLISHTQHRRLTMLRKSEGFSQLLQIMRSNLWRLLFLTIYAGVSSLIATQFLEVMMVGLAFAVTLSLIAFAALIWSTMAVLSIPLD